MRVELRYVPDCPNLPEARALLYGCLDQAGLDVEVVEMVGDYPSPSIVIDGVDVGGAGDEGACCRLSLPTPEQITSALRQADGDGSLPGAGDPIRRDRASRAAALPPDLRQVHRAVLRHFAATGTAPSPQVLAGIAADAGCDLTDALDRLSQGDLLAVRQGRLVAAYPFSPTPTGHVVEQGGVRVYAMCAIDALGIPAMLHADAVITSADPHTGRPVTVAVIAGQATFDPPSAVVVYAASDAAGGSVDTCCSTVNFFSSADSANAWIAAHPRLQAAVLDHKAALQLGRDIFATLLDD